MSKFFDLEIISNKPTTENAVVLEFAIPPELSDQFSFVPGQYLTLRADLNGEDIRRSYSICSAKQDATLEVGIKQVEGGQFSNFVRSLKSGDSLKVMPPQGRFLAEIGGTHNYLLLAAGSGITPCLSILKSVLELEPDSQVTLVYCNQNSTSVMFKDELNDLKDRYLERFSLVHLLSRERQDVELFNGRLSGERLTALKDADVIQPELADAIYICGPQAMTDDLTTTLQSFNIAAEKIKTELFATDGYQSKQSVSRVVDPERGIPVEILMDGTNRQIHVDGKAETVLAAAQRQGLDLPFSCAGGMCCTCRCKVTAGEVTMDQNYSLQTWEVENGFVLACQSRPVSDKLSLDFDAA